MKHLIYIGDVPHLSYKNYIGTFEFCLQSMKYHGRVLSIPAHITYQSSSLKALSVDFEAAVDDYIDTLTTTFGEI